jgi:hypothetical protein
MVSFVQATPDSRMPPPGLAPGQGLSIQSLDGFKGIKPDLNFQGRKGEMERVFFADGKKGWGDIEVRIQGELAAVVDNKGRFILPPGISNRTNLDFSVGGTVFFTAPAPAAGKVIHPPSDPIGDGTLYGVVYDEEGGVPGALVIVSDGEDYAFDVTNSLGIYSVNGAPTGQVLVIALADLHHPEIKAMELLPGEPLELDIFLPIAQGLGKLCGCAWDPNSGPLSGVYVNYSQPAGGVWEDITNVYGMYELNDIPAGIGQLYGYKAGYHDFILDLFVAPGVNNQDFPMIPIELGAVTGEVTALDGTPLAGALVRLTYPKLEGGYDWAFTYTEEEGYFAFGDIPPGSYVVQSFIPGWHPGIAIGTVFEGQVDHKELLMWWTEERGTLEGWAVSFDGEPVSYAFGYVSYIGFDEEVSGWTMADENGHFLVEDVPFGPYAIHVESAVFLPDWAFSDILPEVEEEFLTILYPFDPNLAGALMGTVYDAHGAPVPGSLVGCWALGDESLSFKTFTDDQGQYLFPLLPPTVYGALALHPEKGVGSGLGEVFTSQETIVDIFLVPFSRSCHFH